MSFPRPLSAVSTALALVVGWTTLRVQQTSSIIPAGVYGGGWP
jgi:hypothetical protein